MAETIIKDVKLKIGTETQFQSKLKDLAVGTLVGTTDSISESDLDTTIVNKLTLASNALPKPTNDSTGSTGQVLKKTSSGSKWSDESGKEFYRHFVKLESGSDTVILNFISTNSATITNVNDLATIANYSYLIATGYVQGGFAISYITDTSTVEYILDGSVETYSMSDSTITDIVTTL